MFSPRHGTFSAISPISSPWSPKSLCEADNAYHYFQTPRPDTELVSVTQLCCGSPSPLALFYSVGLSGRRRSSMRWPTPSAVVKVLGGLARRSRHAVSPKAPSDGHRLCHSRPFFARIHPTCPPTGRLSSRTSIGQGHSWFPRLTKPSMHRHNKDPAALRAIWRGRVRTRRTSYARTARWRTPPRPGTVPSHFEPMVESPSCPHCRRIIGHSHTKARAWKNHVLNALSGNASRQDTVR